MDATNLNEERWTKLHSRWSELVQLINLDGTFFDDANISELIDIEKKIWSCCLDFKKAGLTILGMGLKPSKITKPTFPAIF